VSYVGNDGNGLTVSS